MSQNVILLKLNAQIINLHQIFGPIQLFTISRNEKKHQIHNHLPKLTNVNIAKRVSMPTNTNNIIEITMSTINTYVCHQRKYEMPHVTGIVKSNDKMIEKGLSVKLPFLPIK